MKKLMQFVIVMLIIASNISFAQRYHIEPKEDQLTDEGRPYYKPSTSPGESREEGAGTPYPAGTPGQQQGMSPGQDISPGQQGMYPGPLRTGTQYDKIYNDDHQYILAYPFSFEINANGSDVEAVFGRTWEEDADTFLTAFKLGGFYSADNYEIAGASFTLGNRHLIENTKLEMGFKGFLGRAEDGSDKADMGGVGFLLSGEYDIPDVDLFYYGVPLNFELSAEISMAPGQLCSGDLEEYLEIKSSFGVYLLEQNKGIIFVGFRSLRTDFEADDDSWKKSHNSVFLGYKFIF